MSSLPHVHSAPVFYACLLWAFLFAFLSGFLGWTFLSLWMVHPVKSFQGASGIPCVPVLWQVTISVSSHRGTS